jgi:uncharacterized paraquat-inducible protein A
MKKQKQHNKKKLARIAYAEQCLKCDWSGPSQEDGLCPRCGTPFKEE